MSPHEIDILVGNRQEPSMQWASKRTQIFSSMILVSKYWEPSIYSKFLEEKQKYVWSISSESYSLAGKTKLMPRLQKNT